MFPFIIPRYLYVCMYSCNDVHSQDNAYYILKLVVHTIRTDRQLYI